MILLPFLFQALIIFLDEFCFHVPRGLPKWERIGHPLDTLSVLICFAFTLLFPPTYIKTYIALSLLSCIMVTKDEFIHKHVCPTLEMWLHALLFLIHPLMLICLGILWHTGTYRPFLYAQTALIALFGLYQAIYWNFIWKPSTTPSTTN